ncbi:hypothetical protein WM43_04605 [Aeromonas veronii]|uniref:Uncharacterized protein n=1 Tax=Aeromonas veronii TaxID=654 RepID=A0AAC9FKY5_AERVE|nr:hypothetical protein WM43_04605 [Aeromonas veronii]
MKPEGIALMIWPVMVLRHVLLKNMVVHQKAIQIFVCLDWLRIIKIGSLAIFLTDSECSWLMHHQQQSPVIYLRMDITLFTTIQDSAVV